MSVIGGIYSIEGCAVGDADLDRLMGVDPSYGPDQDGRRLLGSVAMGYRGLWTTEEHRSETQPCSDTDGTCWVISDARIDNRSELLGLITDSHWGCKSVSDSVLIISAYKKWGTDCARRIIGDFAFAVWDSKARRLFCARDALGVRPLCYAFNGGTFVFSSFVRQLKAYRGNDLSLDDDYIADFLARGDCPNERTVYRGIKRLMAGHAVLIEGGMLKQIKYWDFDPHRTIQYRADEDYEAHFREVFSKAVEARLRANGPIAADLSGGLDSSSIVCMAEEIYRANQCSGKHVIAYTDLYASPKAHESRWVDAVVSKYGIESIRRKDDSNLFLPNFDPGADCWDEPTLKNLVLPEIREKGKVLSDRGSRILLSGIGGDQLWPAEPCHLADLLRRFTWTDLLREAVRWQRVTSQPVSGVLLEYALKPILYPNAMFVVRKQSEVVLSWINTAFWRNFKIRDRMLHRRGFLPRRSLGIAQQRHYLGIMRTSAALVGGYMMKAPIEVRYPYLDRRLVEFAIAIPMQQKLRPEETRTIVRRGMRGILPESIRTRRSKGWFDEPLLLKLSRERSMLEKWLRSSRAAAHGYVDPVEFCRQFELTLAGHCQNFYLFMAALSLEIWLRGNESSEAKWQLVPVRRRASGTKQDSLALPPTRPRTQKKAKEV
jgi:asparagine synthase (glutamine-hydrolysing)